MIPFRYVVASCFATLTVGQVLGQGQPHVKPASEACVRAVDPHKLLKLNDAVIRIERNVLSLQHGMGANERDFERANDLARVSSDLTILLGWLADLGLIAQNIQAAGDKKFVSIVLGNTTTSVLVRLDLLLKQVNLALSRMRGPALVAEARALRDEIDRLATALRPCGIQ